MIREFLVVDSVECAAKIHVCNINVTVVGSGVFEEVDKALKMPRCVVSSTEAFLGRAEDVMVF
jgi:hypothetical protein